jgi:hypothetical protein
MNAKNTLIEPLVIERTFNAPVARVWKALTNVADMRRWYFDLKEFKPEVGFEFEFTVEHEGVHYCHLCKVTEAISPKNSLTPGVIKARRVIRWSHLNCSLRATTRD